MRLRLHDRRSLLGAIALVTTGGILSWMLEIYLQATSGTPGLPRSRIWWELVLNLQIFSAALMWFCFSDSIENSSGSLQRLQRVRRLFGMIAVLVPTAVGFFGIFQNWYMHRPQPQVVTIIIVAIALFWFLVVWVDMRVQRRSTSYMLPAPIWYPLISLIPVIALLLIFLVDYPSGGQVWVLAVPLLAYLYGALPYIVRAFGLR